MSKKIDNNVLYTTKNNYEFEKVEIFLRVKGRLPNKSGDKLTQEILDEFCDKVVKGEMKQGMVNLTYLWQLIKFGDIKPNY